ncbi:MAG: LPXTG cell wall anchor domain-containing protein, partial [Phenylobacterium sp.]|nr:LPXTG cell wall anchor domain-containing protein [Phenylobacterium sp.]
QAPTLLAAAGIALLAMAGAGVLLWRRLRRGRAPP